MQVSEKKKRRKALCVQFTTIKLWSGLFFFMSHESSGNTKKKKKLKLRKQRAEKNGWTKYN